MVEPAGYHTPRPDARLLVAAGGGHLAQLDRLAPRIPGVDGRRGVGDVSTLLRSRSLLRDRRYVFVPYSGPRDIRSTLCNTRIAALSYGRSSRRWS